jgi:hypothetical protein
MPIIWDAYVKYLHNLITDPANRKITAYEKLKEIKQGNKQIIRNLRFAIELLK